MAIDCYVEELGHPVTEVAPWQLPFVAGDVSELPK
jgi:hypothetical protein